MSPFVGEPGTKQCVDTVESSPPKTRTIGLVPANRLGKPAKYVDGNLLPAKDEDKFTDAIKLSKGTA
jgi:hypothetical protein